MRVVVGLGSNVGARLVNLRAAIAKLAVRAPILGASRVYETAPVGGPPQGDFLNAALAIAWSGEPLALLDALLAIERELGRERRASDIRFGPRTIDLDILWIEGRAIDLAPRLVVPHPRLRERAFALAPLLDVAPGAADPTTRERYSVPAEQELRAIDEPLVERAARDV
jgi:2-amino-4-hydroxy-6-hydroxymethyldihydropteridine diphosphokinase